MISYFVTGCTSGRRVSDGERKHSSVVASFAASVPKKKEKKKAFDEEKNDDDARGKVWKARAADATGRGGRDARRWEATSCVRPRAPAAARARGSWPPRRRAASGREPRRSPSRRPIAFHLGDLMSLRCRRARPRPSPSPSISSIESPLPPRTASARRDAGRVPLACPRARMSARHEGCAR